MMNKLRNAFALNVSFFAFALVCHGCGSGVSPQVATAENVDPDNERDTETAVDESDYQIDGLLGTISIEEVRRVFDRHMKRILNCYSQALDELEEIEGQVEIALQIDPRGTVVQAHVRTGDLGSLEAESCMLNKVAGFTFSRTGGGIAHVSYPITLEAPYDPVEPMHWNDSKVEEVIQENRADLDKCLQGRNGVHITLYVGRGGVVLSAGASAQNYEMYEAACCLAKSARGWTLRDPKTGLAKVRLEL